MRITSKNALDAYQLQKKSSPSASDSNGGQLERHIKKTREVLTGERDSESFAAILHRASKAIHH